MSASNTTTGRSRLCQQYNDRQKQVTPAIQQLPGTGLLRRPPSVRRTPSAQLYMANTAAYRHLPIHYRIPQRRTATCPERGSARGKSGLRNSERLSPSQTCPRQSVPQERKVHAKVSPRKGKVHAKVSPRKGKVHCQSVPQERKSPRQSVPPGKEKALRQEHPSDARHCTISGTIFSLFLSIIQFHVYYKEHTSNLLTLKSESVILWSS